MTSVEIDASALTAMSPFAELLTGVSNEDELLLRIESSVKDSIQAPKADEIRRELAREIMRRMTPQV